MIDILITGGFIVDGSGNPPFISDLGIKDGKIVSLGGQISESAVRVIEATGKVVTPGFIDLHSHADLRLLDDSSGAIKLKQGVTTEIFGNCGFSAAPIAVDSLTLLQTYSEPIMGKLNAPWNWKTYGEYLDQLKKKKLGHHCGGLVGNGALRIAVKGFAASSLTRQEMEQVKQLLRESLLTGAFGLSLGLMYAPENYYHLDELVEICSVIREYGAILTTHIRGEGNSLLRSIREVLTIAERAEIPLHISHLKAAGKNNWGAHCEAAIELIDHARSAGMDVTCDVYPYTAGSSALASLLPPWTVEGGIGKAIQRLSDAAERHKIVTELVHEATDWDNLVYSTGWDSVVVSSVETSINQWTVGKSIAEIAVIRNEEPVVTVLNLLAEEEGKVAIVFFHMAETDMTTILKLDYASVISDSLYSSGGIPHPRLYGTFPRLLARYVREKQILSLADAVRKITSLPAQRLKLNAVGRLECGYDADITIFDPDTILDLATYTAPRQFPEGIEYVLVGGEIACQSGELTGARKGKLFTRT
jgi:N-acyl-D-amino-acid deacylase